MKTHTLKADILGERLRSLLMNKGNKSILISYLGDSTQASDIHNLNCGGYGRLWHKRVAPEENWGPIDLPHYPASAKLGISPEEASLIQVFQSAGCNYRCWFCYVDYRLLKADLNRGKFFTARELVAGLQSEAVLPKVIRLSGGQPDLTPEWTPWMMQALEEAGLSDSTYLWLDDNLSNDYAWRYLTDDDWNLMLGYRNFGRVGCIKGISPASFHFNTRAPREHFYRQFEILNRLVRTGLDVYVYLILTVAGETDIDDSIKSLLDRLQNIHPLLPLRVTPLKIKPFTPTVGRMKTEEQKSLMTNQFRARESWNREMQRRFFSQQLKIPCYDVSITNS